MVVASAEAAQHHFTFVGFAIAIGVLEEEQFGTVPDVSAVFDDFEAGRNHKAAGEDGRFVGAAIRGRIFQDKDFVVGHLARFKLWIDSAADHPEPAAVIESHLDRFDYAIGLGSKQRDFKAAGELEVGKLGSAGERHKREHYQST